MEAEAEHPFFSPVWGEVFTLHVCKEQNFSAQGNLAAGDTSCLGGDTAGPSCIHGVLPRLSLAYLVHFTLWFCSVPLHGGDRGSRTRHGWQWFPCLPAAIPVKPVSPPAGQPPAGPWLRFKVLSWAPRARVVWTPLCDAVFCW